MPELPEVETIVRQLSHYLPGRRILGGEIRRPDLLREEADSFLGGLEGLMIRRVSRRGKNILLHLSTNQILLVNLGMTGQLLFRSGAMEGRDPVHLAVTLTLSGAGFLLYTDVRRFGHLLRFSRGAWEEESRRLGPEPLERALTAARFHAALRTSRTPIRSWLLDQTRIAGVGNIYAAEALFRAGIHPARPSRSLTPEESKALLAGIRKVMREAIRARGTTLKDYRTADGDRGRFGPALQVYGRDGEECPTCKSPLRRIVFANRSAFFCPRCQPEGL
ncbi:MAG: bifunctional DNA-formamidopyrimidine glycosylase/DNA-(apurinic or apyrimidinic site) lyase [Gemmatimonadota bacterium]|jgi:formamidopyrimidine-DNA glycosylase